MSVFKMNKAKSIKYIRTFFRNASNPVKIFYIVINSFFLFFSLFTLNVVLISYLFNFLKCHYNRCPHHIYRYRAKKISHVDFENKCNFFENKRIAIVGNASSLLSKGYGDLINDYDIVVRINRANIVDEVAQGNKTTVWATSFKYENTLDGYEFLLWLTPFFHSRLCYPSKEMLENGLLLYSFGEWKSLGDSIGAYPTSGLMILDFLMGNTKYKNISLFGFDFFKTPNHYENKIFNGHKFHDFNREELYVSEIVKNKKNRVELYV